MDLRAFWDLTNIICTQPNIDILATEKETIIYADVPGVKKEDLNIQTEGSHVSISGEFKRPSTYTNDDIYYRRLERCFGKFTRNIPLDQAVKDPATVSAKLENGVLEINVPRQDPNITKVPIK